MTFHPKGLIALFGFLAVVWLGVYARSGQIHPRWVIAGVGAYVVIEVLTFFGVGFVNRSRSK